MLHPSSRIHLIGIAGTGMGAFAGLLKKAGYNVQGSDNNTYPPMKDKLAAWKIPVKTPYSSDNLRPAPDLIIVGNVAGQNNVEAAYARDRAIPFTSFPKALSDFFLKRSCPVVVAGTHGKTTTTALLAYAFYHAGYDPSFLIGGIPVNFEESFRLGTLSPKHPFVVEGDEYDTSYFDKGPKFLHYRPRYLLTTSLEYDHADIYKNVEEIALRFRQLFKLVPKDGVIVAHHNSPHLQKALKAARPKAPVWTYGEGGDFTAHDMSLGEFGVRFVVHHQGKALGNLHLQLAGHHNIENALGAYAIMHAYGVPHEAIAAAFTNFKGVKRRLEEIGEAGGVLVLDDFAHHPSAVAATIKAAKSRYPGRELWAIFEPRSATSCRKVFQDDYAKSFSDAAQVLLAPSGRKLDDDIMLSVPQLAEDIRQGGQKATHFESIDAIVDYVAQNPPKNAVLLCMSNGAFGGIHQRLLQVLR